MSQSHILVVHLFKSIIMSQMKYLWFSHILLKVRNIQFIWKPQKL